MAATSSSAAVSAMAQRASQQYLECRRSVTAKVDEVKLLDEQIAAVFQQISALSGAPEGQEDLSDEQKAAAKSIGRLEVVLIGVEGEEPVPNATITVALDPEYEADEFETVEEVDEKKDIVVTDEHGHVVEDGQVSDEDGEHTPRKLKTTTKITRTIVKKRVKKEKEPVVRTIAWNAPLKSDEDEVTALTFPASFVFDPVQSREAIVIITVAAASTEDDQEPDVLKEIEIPVSSLFQDHVLNKWYTVGDEETEDEPTTITELVEEVINEVIERDAATEKSDDVDKVDISENTESHENPEGSNEEKKPQDAEKNEASEKMEGIETVEQDKKTNGEVESAERVEEDVKEVGQEKSKSVKSRFQVKVSFALSEAEKLSTSVVALSKKKQEAEAQLQVLEREASSLRIKYDRLNASQRQMSASGLSKPKSSLLTSRFGAVNVPVQRKSWYRSSYERATSFATKHQQLLVSVAMFTGSVCLFHYNGENLLA
ncbi:hypothetical protein Plhal304r1_c006g0023781 [Plasmopara halstedii]